MGIIFTGSRHSIRPSLNLDFANSKALDPRITFSRTSNATYYDGYTTVKAEENLVKYSQDFDNAYWLKEAATVTANSTSAPDGTTTAELLLETAASGTHKIYPNPPPYNSVTGNSFTVSIYCKSYVSDRYLGLVSQLGGGSRVSVRFDPSTQTLSSVLIVGSEITNVTAGYQDVGNGWYRVYLSGTFSAGNVYIAAAPSNTMTPLDQSYGFSSYSGDVTKGIYLWGAQIEQKDNVSAYTPTTNSLITKYQPALQTAGNNVARFDHNPTTGESLGLLIEEQRTNLVNISEDISDASFTTNFITKQGSTLIAPDGTLTAGTITSTSGTAGMRLQKNATSSTGVAVTYSIYVKKGNNRYVTIGDRGESTEPWSTFDFDTESITGSPIVTTVNSTSVGNGWYRISMTWTKQNASFAGIVAFKSSFATTNTTPSFVGTGYETIHIWGMQLEVGSFPTSYIKTTGSQVTRSYDDAEMKNINQDDWFKQSKGTWFVNAKTFEPISISDKRIIHVDNTTNGSNRFPDIYIDYDDVKALFIKQGLTLSVTNFVSSDTYFKYSLAYEYQNANVAGDGTAETVNTTLTGSTSDLTTIYIGNYNGGYYFLNGYIKKLSYYPLRLTDNEIIDLTEE